MAILGVMSLTRPVICLLLGWRMEATMSKKDIQ